MRVAVTLASVPLRVEVDPLTGVIGAGRSAGLSAADRSALERALRLAAGTGAAAVTAVTAGPASAEGVLREALAAGARSAVRVELPDDADPAAVAAALATAVTGHELVCCGDHGTGPTGGTGSVPAFLAARLGAAQALGLLSAAWDGDAVRAERRLDGGRRERLRVPPPAVLSFEPGPRLRRAALPAVLAARGAPVTVLPGPGVTQVSAGRVRPYRPRPRVLPGPPSGLDPRERALQLSSGPTDRQPPKIVHVDPGRAADLLLDYLRGHGYR
jgi:electron transfer flavoprotein beta subunit